ncbi:MAG: tryptophan synthase subunit beta, partial [candidate division Zixibacteria bacterium]|nr:tryptophan synthase subunit beta [candidate division Zixibacteria bacterium]
MRAQVELELPRPGYFGRFGGQFVPETLIAPLQEVTRVYEAARKNPEFWAELKAYLKDYVGRPSPLYH